MIVNPSHYIKQAPIKPAGRGRKRGDCPASEQLSDLGAKGLLGASVTQRFTVDRHLTDVEQSKRGVYMVGQAQKVAAQLSEYAMLAHVSPSQLTAARVWRAVFCRTRRQNEEDNMTCGV